MTDEQRNKCKQILEHYGAENQRRQLCEECAELIQAAIKYDRTSRNLEAYSRLCEELADVMIMIEQVRLTVSENVVNSFINEKIERQIRRIEDELKRTVRESNCKTGGGKR